MGRNAPISWAPRISREKLLDLYVKIAEGDDDPDLINEIAEAFYNRCSDIIRICERRFSCPACGSELPAPHTPGTTLRCDDCDWKMYWGSFYRTIKGKQLSVNVDQTEEPHRFVADLPACKTPQEKMILIDGLIHACHEWVRRGVTYYGRPLAVNFIEGSMNQVVTFLENLPDAPDSMQEINRNYLEWRKKVLSLFDDSDAEIDRIRQAEQALSEDVRLEVEGFLKVNLHQKAVHRVREVPGYAEKLTVHKGDIASQVVRLIQRKMKQA